MRPAALAGLLLAACLPGAASAAAAIVIGGKIFTESYVLGEMAAQTIEAASSTPVTRKLGMGSTGILFESLTTGAIDVYSDYTGTLAEAILKRPDLKSLDDIRTALMAMDLVVSGPLGFDLRPRQERFEPPPRWSVELVGRPSCCSGKPPPRGFGPSCACISRWHEELLPGCP